MLTGKESAKYSRKPEILADAAYHILSQDPATTTGNFFIDDEVLSKAGVTDFDQYCCDPAYKDQLMIDFFVGSEPVQGALANASARGTAKVEKKPVGKVGQLFKAIESNLSEELVERTQAVYQFNVTGKEEGTW